MAVIHGGQRKIGSGISDIEVASARYHPEGPERQNHECHGLGNVLHDGAEAFRRLAHGGIEARAQDAVEYHQSSEREANELPHIRS